MIKIILGYIYVIGVAYYFTGSTYRDGGSPSWNTIGSFVWFIWFPIKWIYSYIIHNASQKKDCDRSPTKRWKI